MPRTQIKPSSKYNWSQPDMSKGKPSLRHPSLAPVAKPKGRTTVKHELSNGGSIFDLTPAKKPSQAMLEGRAVNRNRMDRKAAEPCYQAWKNKAKG